MKTKLQSDGTIMPRSSAAIGCAVATFDLSENASRTPSSGHHCKIESEPVAYLGSQEHQAQ
jgi:hypothetical protein